MGEYKAKGREEGQKGKGNASNKVKEKGASMALEAAGVPKPLAKFASKQLGKRNPRMPGTPKSPFTPPVNKKNNAEKNKKENDKQEKQNDKKTGNNPLDPLDVGKRMNPAESNNNENQEEVDVEASIVKKVLLSTILGAVTSMLPLFVITLTIIIMLSMFSKYNAENNAHNISSTIGENSNADSSSSNVSNIILIGDSRTVGMYAAVNNKSDGDSVFATDGNDVTWSAKGSMGYNWLVSTGAPQVESKIQQDTAIAILMGVNDLYNVDKYASYLNSQSKEWSKKGASTHFVSVNPVNESKASSYGYEDSNSAIENFNKKIKSQLSGVSYIDTYNSIKGDMSDGTLDGVHYTNQVYNKIYKIITEKLKSSTGSGKMGPANGIQGKFYAPVQKKLSMYDTTGEGFLHDLGSVTGDPIYAPADGTATFQTITYNGQIASYGNVITITTDDGYRFVLAHLNSFEGYSVKFGSESSGISCRNKGCSTHTYGSRQVKKRELIGTSGKSGNTRGNPPDHLHFEIWRSGVRQQPAGLVGY